MARVMDIGGTLNEYDEIDIDAILAKANNGLTGAEADAAAIRECWEAVGKDMYYAIGQFENEYGEGSNPRMTRQTE